MEIDIKRNVVLIRKRYEKTLGGKVPHFTGMNIIEQHNILDYVSFLEFALANKLNETNQLEDELMELKAEINDYSYLSRRGMVVGVDNIFKCIDELIAREKEQETKDTK